MKTSVPTRPALRYHGGKWLLSDWIISHFPEHKVYVEPFGGAMSVLLNKQRSYAEVYNDLDSEIVNVFAMLRDHGAELQSLLQLTPFARTELDIAYKPTTDLVEKARRTIIKSFMGFGSDAIKNKSGFRSNSNRSGTTPAHDWANYADCIQPLIDRLAGVVIENRKADLIIQQQDSEDTLFYIDPPYVHSTRASENPKQYRFEMTDDDHRELAILLKSVKGKVVLSGYDSPLYKELYGDWEQEMKESYADGAKKRVEVLYLNFKAHAKLL